MTLAPDPVVEHFYVIEDIRPGQILGFIYAFSDPFFFQRTEGLVDGVFWGGPETIHTLVQQKMINRN